MSIQCLVGILETTNSFITKTSSINASKLVVDLSATLYHISDSGDFGPYSILYQIDYRKVGDVPWLPFGDNLHLVPGYYDYTTEALIPDTYQAGYQLTNSKAELLHKTHELTPADTTASYEVRVTRLSPSSTANNIGSSFTFEQLRTHQADRC